MKATSRLKRIAKVMEEKQLSAHPWRYIVCNFGESKEDAIARSGYDPDDKYVIIVKFADEATWPARKKKAVPQPKRNLADIDAEMSKLKDDLIQDGLTEAQIDELVGNDS